MSKTGIIITALFLGLALFSGGRSLLQSTEVARPPEVEEDSTPSPSATELDAFPTFEGPAPKPKKYNSTEELTADLAARGIECSSLEYLDQPDRTLEEFSLCDPGTYERRFNIYFYPSRPNRQLWLQGMREQELPLPLVWGPNWIVVAAGDPETAHTRIKSIQGAIGGTIEDFSPKKK